MRPAKSSCTGSARRRAKTCKADLERVIALREAGGVYVIAYMNGSQRQAKTLDPIRESEGVGHGTVAYGPGVSKLMKLLGTKKGPYSIVVDVDGKVKAVSTSGDINELDARDTMVKSLVEAVKPFTTSNEGTQAAKPNEKMTFTYKVQLANWLTFSQKTPMEFTFASSKEVKCDATTLKADKMKIEGHTLTARSRARRRRAAIKRAAKSGSVTTRRPVARVSVMTA